MGENNLWEKQSDYIKDTYKYESMKKYVIGVEIH